MTEELAHSREEIATHLGIPCKTIAYPYGDTDERVASCARRVGYNAGASLSRRLTALGPHRWPRIGVYHTDQSWRFRMKASRGWRRLRATPLWPADQPASPSRRSIATWRHPRDRAR